MVVINGKFLSASMTGVHRVALELTQQLMELRLERHPSTRGLSFSLYAPMDAKIVNELFEKEVGIKVPFRGIPWEQLTLPLFSRKSTLLNLCNSGPALHRRSITMIHDAQVHVSPDSYKFGFRLWYKAIQPRLARKGNKIITISSFSQSEISKSLKIDKDRIAVIPNGSDHVLRCGRDVSILSKLKIVEGRYVVALASTQAHKNIKILLEAFADDGLTDITLVLFGTAARQDFVSKGWVIPPNTIFAGRVSDAELRTLYEHAVAMAFPSLTEGFGLPPLEAMALGCATIVSPCGAIPEVCGEAPIYADPKNFREWVQGIDVLSKDSEKRVAHREAGLVNASRYRWRESAIKLAHLLSDIEGAQ